MTSKLIPHDTGQFLLKAGVVESLLTVGFVCTVHAVHHDGFEAILPNGESRRVAFDIYLPTTLAKQKVSRWIKTLDKCQRRSIHIRCIGTNFVQGKDWVANENSFFLEQCRIIQGEDIRLYEWFSGGVGGWSRAASFLRANQYPMYVAGAADWDPNMVNMWNANSNHVHRNQQEAPKCIENDVRNIDSWHDAMQSEPTAMSLSSSCRSFSLTGLKGGWNSVDGETLAIALWFAFLHGCNWLVIENVANLKHDPNLYQQLLRILEFCNYVIVYEQVIPLVKHHPVERHRLIMVVTSNKRGNEQGKIRECIDETVAAFHRTKPRMNMYDSKRWIDLPQDLVEEVVLTEDMIQIYGDFHRLPDQFKSRVIVQAKNVIEARKSHPSEALSAGTCMASYTKQHELAMRSDAINQKILGALKKRESLWTFFHPCEIAVALGIHTALIMPANVQLAMQAVGNSIAEAHAIVGLVALIKIMNTGTPQNKSIEDILRHHSACCINNMKFALRWDHEKVEVFPVDRKVPRIQAAITIAPTENHVDTTPFEIRVASQVTSDMIRSAEMQLNRWQSVLLVDQSQRVLQDANPIDDPKISMFTETCHSNRDKGGIWCYFPEFVCWVPWNLQSNVARFSINGFPFEKFCWEDQNKGNANLKLIHEGEEFFTHDECGFPSVIPEQHVLVIRVCDNSIDGQLIKFHPNSRVEDLMLAEQCLGGPITRVHSPRDAEGNVLHPSDQLQTTQVVVLQHDMKKDQITIRITKQDEAICFVRDKGTRPFEIIPVTEELLVDEKDFVIPWDFPIFRDIDLTVERKTSIIDDEFEVSPTIPYQIEDEEVQQNPQNLAHEVANMIEKQTKDMFSKVANVIHEYRDANDKFIEQRFQQMLNHGIELGDDELCFALGFLGYDKQNVAHGTVKWSQNKFESLEGQSNPILEGAACELAFVHGNNHWIPFIIKRDESIVEYLHHGVIEAELWDQFLMRFKLNTTTRLHHVHSQSVDGWCGWTALYWCFQKIGLNLALISDEWIQEMWMSMAGMVDPEKVQSLRTYMSLNEDPVGRFAENLRLRFIAHQLKSPTIALCHGRAGTEPGSQAQLRLTGRIAAVLISKGHQSEESIRISQALVQKSKNIKNIISMKEGRAYATIVEECATNDIQISTLSQTQAVQKLQKFFRSKQHGTKQKRKESNIIDLAQINFIPGTFAIKNGEQNEVINPGGTWGITSKGLSIAKWTEVQPIVLQGKILTCDVNTAITSEPIETNGQIQVDEITIPVEDESKNRALIRVYLIHFGQKKVIKAPITTGYVDVAPTQTVSLHVFRDHVDPRWWDTLTESPAKTCLKELFPDGVSNPISQVWSRQWLSGRAIVSTKVATCFSMLCAIQKSEVSKWLRLSGLTTNPIFVSIKRSPETTSDDGGYRVIWLGKNLSEAISLVGTVVDHYGYVHHPPSSFGMRVANSRFPSAWKELKSDEAVPSTVKGSHRFTISGAPSFIKGQDIEKWAETLSWQIRVLKKFGDSRFLVCADKDPPSFHMTLNNYEMLIEKQKETARPMKQIVVGKLNIPSHSSSSTSKDIDDPWKNAKIGTTSVTSLGGDPWARYKGISKPSGDATMASIDIEDHTQTVITKQADRITSIEAQIEQMKHQMDENREKTEQKIEKVEHEVAEMSSNLKTSLQDALKEQSQSLIATFEALMKRSPRGKTAPEAPREEKSRSPKRNS